MTSNSHKPAHKSDANAAPGASQKKVLFVCMGNCVRSQMAEAIARHVAGDIIIAESAGLNPLGFIDKTVCAVLTQRKISYEGQYSKGLHSHKLGKPDLVINMSGVSGQKYFAGHEFEDWSIRDPFGEDVPSHEEVFTDILRRIEDLAWRLRSPELAGE